jgi:hypothetical protein
VFVPIVEGEIEEEEEEEEEVVVVVEVERRRDKRLQKNKKTPAQSCTLSPTQQGVTMLSFLWLRIWGWMRMGLVCCHIVHFSIAYRLEVRD